MELRFITEGTALQIHFFDEIRNDYDDRSGFNSKLVRTMEPADLFVSCDATSKLIIGQKVLVRFFKGNEGYQLRGEI